MILELDAGNTRIKWRLLSEKRDTVLLPERAGAFRMEENSAAWDLRFIDYLAGLDLKPMGRILVSNVRGEGFRDSLNRGVEKIWNLRPEFAVPSHYCAGVTNGYVDPEKLGIDRWLSLLASYHQARCSCWVVNCGTTITIDHVAAGGEHMGGFIVPGLQLLKSALASKSSVLASQNKSGVHLALGRDTSSAINNGVLTMAVGLITALKADSGDPQAVWFTTGGDGEIVSSNLKWETKYVPSLVMDGLLLAFP